MTEYRALGALRAAWIFYRMVRRLPYRSIIVYFPGGKFARYCD